MGCGLSQPEKKIRLPQKQVAPYKKDLDLNNNKVDKHLNQSMTTLCVTPQNYTLQNSKASHNFGGEENTSRSQEEETQTIKNMLKSIESRIPERKVSEKYINARKSFRLKENLDENPAPIISSNLFNSRLFKKRSMLIQQIEHQENESRKSSESLIKSK